MSGDKTEHNLGLPRQGWMVKTDSLGNMQWDKTIFTLPGDYSYTYGIQSEYGCYIVTKATAGGIAGYKSQQNWDTTNSTCDYWIVKFCDSTLTTNIANTEKANEQLLLFPNPNTGKFTIQNSSLKIDRIEIYNLIGEKMSIVAVGC